MADEHEDKLLEVLHTEKTDVRNRYNAVIRSITICGGLTEVLDKPACEISRWLQDYCGEEKADMVVTQERYDAMHEIGEALKQLSELTTKIRS